LRVAQAAQAAFVTLAERFSATAAQRPAGLKPSACTTKPAYAG